jgi:hypothetical protein
MSQQNDTRSRTAARISDAPPADGATDHPTEDLSIFSAPALEVVFQWWFESNRRWTERNSSKAPAA